MGSWRDLAGGRDRSIGGGVRGAISPVDEIGRSVGGFVALNLELGRRTVGRWIVGRWIVGRRTRARSVEAHRLACLALWSSVTTSLECVCEECLECEKLRRGIIDLKVK